MRLQFCALLIGAALFATADARAQTTGMVAGTVTDGAGVPVPGVAVAVRGTPRGAVSGPDGRYTITAVPAGPHTLRATKIGFNEAARSFTVTAGGTASVNLQLTATAVALEGVVAVGYGTQRRQDITGAIASIEMDQARSAPLSSVEQVLQGRAAGVQVVQANGAPGGAASVRIRGTNSITANSEPLYVVDGVPAFTGSGSRNPGASINPLAELSPNDIASIEILKDASATAIYGSRGANGVVLITTRRGTRGENTVQFESSYGVQEVARTLPVLNAQQFADLANESRVNAGQKALFTPDQIAAFGVGTDWQKEIFRSAPVQSHAGTISGGDEKTRYLVSGSLFDQQGIIIDSGFRRYSARVNLDREVSGRFRIGNSLTVSRTRGNFARTDADQSSGIVVSALEFSPTAPVRDENGSYVPDSPYTIPLANPVASALEITNGETTSRLVGSVFAEYDVAKALRFRSSLGGNLLFARNEYYAPRTTVEGRTTGGSGQLTSTSGTEVVNENILTYRRSVREGHDVDFTGGFTGQTSRRESLGAASQQFATDITGADNLGAGALPSAPSSGVNEWTLLSWLARSNYNLLGKYLFTVTGRYDGSSKFGENSKWGFFPSAAFGWRISEEPFLRDRDWLTDAKLRLSYGVTGNQEIGTYASLPRLVNGVYVHGTSQLVGYAPAGQAPNPDLKWETTRQVNAGVDVAFWDSRVSLTADVYRGTTSDLLLAVPLPTTTGYTSQLRNVGSVQNRGVELGIQTVNVERGRFTWRTSLNLGANRNEVVDVGGAERIFPAGERGGNTFEGGVGNVVQVGRPLGQFFGYKTNGIWQLGEDFRSSGDPYAAPGEWKYVDVNGDGRINASDRTLLGTAEPDVFGGLTNTFDIGSFSLEGFLQGSIGNEVLNAGGVYMRSVTGFANEHVQALDRWTPQNPSNTVPRAYLTRVRRLMDVYVEDASYIRLQNLTAAYQLPDGLIAGAERARLYVSGQNLWLWSDYSGYDPEVNSYGGDAALRGVDLGMYPRSRTVNVGVNLTF